jgi:4-hydroxybenzoate polyprenyltransferase
MFRALFRWLLWTNLLIAGSAAGWVVVTFRSLHRPVDGLLVALAFFLALAFYTRDRLDEKEYQADLISMPERTQWVARHRAGLSRVVIFSFVGAVGLILLRPAALWPLLVGLGFALSYTLRWLPWRGRRLGWKHLPGLKMPFVAGLWTLTSVLTPAFVYNQLSFNQTCLLAGAACLLIMVQILLNDLRDIRGDISGGTLSLPVLIGDRAARRLGAGLMLIALLLAWLLASPVLAGTAAYTLLLLWRYQRSRDFFWRPWIEGQGLLAAALALF